MFKEDTLKEETILVTGGGSGLGLSMAHMFAALGADIAICGRTEAKLKEAFKALQKHGTRIRYYVADVREYPRVGEMFEEIEADFGSITGLVNNAAGNFLSASEDLTPNGFKTVVDIVLHGSFNCTHHFGKTLIRQNRGGTILNIVATYAEHTGSAFVLPSACGKAGVLAMTRSLAYEWAEYHIRVNAIAPGPFPTEGARTRLFPDKTFEENYLKTIPAGRYGEHRELACLAAFLMSDLASYITGECITIDGGERLSAGQFNFLDRALPREALKELFKRMKPRKS